MTKLERLKEYGLTPEMVAGMRYVRVGNVAILYDDLNTTCEVLALQGKRCYCTECWHHGMDESTPIKPPYGSFYVDKAESYIQPDIEFNWSDDRKCEFTYNGKLYKMSYFKECSWWSVRMPTIYGFGGGTGTFRCSEVDMKPQVEQKIMEQIRLDTISVK